jgi:lyso-ornithine lipid O-acyltransferase
LVVFARALSMVLALFDCWREVRAATRYESRETIYRALRLRDASTSVGKCVRLAVRVRGEVPKEPCVIAANHLSYLDPLAIGQVVPLSAVAKSEVTQWPAIGETLDELGIIFVERGNAISGAVALRKAMRTLHAGVSVLVFPEGTTTIGDDVLCFARGAFGVARLLGVPVVPVTLRYDLRDACWVGDTSLVAHVVKLHRHDHIRVELTFGSAIEPMAFADASSLASATRERIRSNVRR